MGLGWCLCSATARAEGEAGLSESFGVVIEPRPPPVQFPDLQDVLHNCTASASKIADECRSELINAHNDELSRIIQAVQAEVGGGAFRELHPTSELSGYGSLQLLEIPNESNPGMQPGTGSNSGAASGGASGLVDVAKKALSDSITNGGAGFAVKIFNNVGGTPTAVLSRAESLCATFSGMIQSTCDSLTKAMTDYERLVLGAVNQMMTLANSATVGSPVEMREVHVHEQSDAATQAGGVSLLNLLNSSSVPIVLKPGSFSSISEEVGTALSNVLSMHKNLVATQRQLLDNIEETAVLVLEDALRSQPGATPL